MRNLTRHAGLLLPALFALLGLIVGFGHAATSPKTYTASNAVLVVGNPQGATAGQANDTEALIRTQMQNFEYLVTSPLVLGPALTKAGLPNTPDNMPGGVSGSATLNTSILEVNVQGQDPAETAKLANAVQESLIDAVTKYGPQAPNGKPVLVAHSVSTATPPAAATAPKPIVEALAGGLVGLALGLALAKLIAARGKSSVDEADEIAITTETGAGRRIEQTRSR